MNYVFSYIDYLKWKLVVGAVFNKRSACIVKVILAGVSIKFPAPCSVEVSYIVLPAHLHIYPAEERQQSRNAIVLAVAVYENLPYIAFSFVKEYRYIFLDEYIRVHQHKPVWKVIEQDIDSLGVLGASPVIGSCMLLVRIFVKELIEIIKVIENLKEK